MKILFWNTHKNEDINIVLKELIVENEISIAILAEYVAPIEELYLSLLSHGVKMFPYLTTGCDRIKIIGSVDTVKPSMQTSYASFQIVNERDILCCIHLPSKIYSASNGMREIIIRQLIQDICEVEKELGSENTVVVGDFNMDPYEEGCVNADMLHGIPVSCEAEKRFRVVAGQEFRMFYNPMWNFLGDFNSPFGTYYFSGNSPSNTFWHLYDQVIIRPDLRQRFVDDSLKIVTQTSSRKFLNHNGRPNKRISDHLPIIFEIKE